MRFFFAGYQRHIGRPHLFDQTGIDLARQKAQRQADDTAAMRHHTLNRVMGLAGVGGAENGRDTAAAQDHGAKIQRTIRESTSSAWRATHINGMGRTHHTWQRLPTKAIGLTRKVLQGDQSTKFSISIQIVEQEKESGENEIDSAAEQSANESNTNR